MSTVLAEATATNPGIRVVPNEKQSKRAIFLPPDSTEFLEAKKTVSLVKSPSRIKFGMLRDRRLRMLKSIPVVIEQRGALTVAHWPEIEEFGYGDSAPEALNDFAKTIEELFITLQEQQAVLGEDLLVTWSKLSEHIEMRSPRG